MSEEKLDKCLFEIGDMVEMRAAACKLMKFRRLPKNDIGFVVEIKPSQKTSNCWLVGVYWQKHSNKQGVPSIYKHTRLKHFKRKKAVYNE
jgi:hypothetical protein